MTEEISLITDVLDIKDKYIVQENMEKYGGSFVKALGKALVYADLNNVRRIKEAFPEYWEQYLHWGSAQ